LGEVQLSKIEQKDKDWEIFNKNKVKRNYPKWPNEAMVKIAFGDYLRNKIIINPELKVLDVGCGFGNNLVPFLDIGCECYGTEVTPEMAAQTQEILKQRGFKADIRFGKNDELPFDDSFFDLLLSINVLHYAQTEDKIGDALREYNRVLKGRQFYLDNCWP
jgi:ubiquinone/menaquinone biosynthesis C-methylase UbiE